MSANAVSSPLPAPSSIVGGSVATIHPRWLAWSRVLWVLIALNSIITFGWMVYLTRQFSDNLPLRVAEGLQELGWTIENYFWFHAVLMALGFACYFVIGVSIFVLRPKDRMAWFASILLLAYGGEIAYPLAFEFVGSLTNAPTLFRVSYLANNLFSWGFLGAFLALFPDGRFVPPWSRFIALFGFLFSFGFGFFPSQFGAPEGPLFVVVIGGGLLLFVGSLYAQVWRYRHHSLQLARQQTKWLIYALALIVVLVFLVSTLIYLLLPPEQVNRATSVAADLLYFLANLTFVLLPLSIGIAIVRYRLWDIDIIIRKTVTYALVVACLVLVYFGSVILLQQLFASLTGARSEIITVISTLTIAALFVPLRNKIQQEIDRRFYRKKYDAQKVLEDFAQTVRDETDLEKLTGRLIEVVNETMQPDRVGVWLKDERLERARK